VSNQYMRPVRLAACLVTATVLLAACGASVGAGQAGAAGPVGGVVNVPTWPAAAPTWSFLPDGTSAPDASATTQPTTSAVANDGTGTTGSSAGGTSGGLSAATEAQLEQLLQQANQALDAASAAASDDAAQSGQDEGVLP